MVILRNGKKSGVAFSTDLRIGEIMKLLPTINIISCRNSQMKCKNNKWKKKLVIIPATEKDRQDLIKLSVQYVIEPILEVGTRIKIQEFTKINFEDLCIKQLLFREGCPHVATGNPCIGQKMHLKQEIGKAICKYINEDKAYPIFMEDQSYNYIISTIKKIQRPKYLRVTPKIAANSFSNIVKELKHALDVHSWEKTQIGKLTDFFSEKTHRSCDLPFYYVRRKPVEGKFLEIGFPRMFKWEINCLVQNSFKLINIKQLECLNNKLIRYIGIIHTRSTKGKSTYTNAEDMLKRTLWFKSQKDELTIWRILSCTKIIQNSKFVFEDKQHSIYPAKSLVLTRTELQNRGYIHVD